MAASFRDPDLRDTVLPHSLTTPSYVGDVQLLVTPRSL